MFFGFVPLGTTTFGFPVQVTNSSRTPSAPDAQPTWRIYAPTGGAAILTGTAPNADVDSQTGWRPVTNVAVTGANGFASGNTYTVRVAYGVSSVNEVDIGTFVVT